MWTLSHPWGYPRVWGGGRGGAWEPGGCLEKKENQGKLFKNDLHRLPTLSIVSVQENRQTKDF